MCADRSAMSLGGATPLLAGNVLGQLTQQDKQYLENKEHFVLDRSVDDLGGEEPEAEAKLDSLLKLGMFSKEESIVSSLQDGEMKQDSREVRYAITDVGRRIRMARFFRTCDPDMQTLLEFYAQTNPPPHGYNQAELAGQLGLTRTEIRSMIKVLVEEKVLCKEVNRFYGTGYRLYYWKGYTLATEIQADSPEWHAALNS